MFSPNQFAAKDLERKSKKCEKEEKAEKLKLKKVSTIHIKINKSILIYQLVMNSYNLQ